MKRSILLILVSILLVVSLGVTPIARAEPPRQEAGFQRIENAAMEEQIAFWTPERMAAAQPLPEELLVIERSPAGVETAPQADGPAGYAPGHGPWGTPAGPNAGTIPNATTATPSHAYPFTFTRGQFYPPRVYTAWPMITFGKLYFLNTAYGPGTWSCSATSIASGAGGNRRLLLTAGACMSSPGSGGTAGSWSYNWLFVPGRRDGTNPNGSWGWTFGVLTNRWYFYGDHRQNFGILTMEDNACGRLGDCIGAQGVAWNQPGDQEWVATGYPYGGSFNGEKMVWCMSHSGRRDSGMAGVGEMPIGIGCDMVGNAGGAWLIQFKQHTTGYVNGLSGYRWASEPLALHGPYFGTDFYNMWQNANDDF